MKKQWRNLSVLVVIVLAAAGVYYIFGPAYYISPSLLFAGEFSGMSNTWGSYGLGSAGLHAQSEALLDLSDAQLGEMKGEISDFGSTAKLASTKALANAYVKLIDYSRAMKQAVALQAETAQLELCENVAKFEVFGDKLSEASSALQNYLASANAFVEDYPSEAAVAEIGAVSGALTGNEATLSTYQSLLDTSKGAC